MIASAGNPYKLIKLFPFTMTTVDFITVCGTALSAVTH